MKRHKTRERQAYREWREAVAVDNEHGSMLSTYDRHAALHQLQMIRWLDKSGVSPFRMQAHRKRSAGRPRPRTRPGRRR